MEEVISGWHYDRICSQYREEVKEAYLEQEKVKKILKKSLSEAKHAIKSRNLHSRSIEEARNYVSRLNRTISTNFASAVLENASRIESSHPILVGPATLDSLITEVPDRLDYIKDGKFPFDRVFFEFMEPTNFNLPGYNLEGKLCGLQLNKALENIEKNSMYHVIAYFDVNRGKYACIALSVFQKYQAILQGQIRLPSDKERIIFKTDSYPDFKFSRETENIPWYPVHTENTSEFRLNLTESDINWRGIESLNVLAINIINYINSQNITLVPRERRIRVANTGVTGRRIVHEIDKPFHIVGIDDKYVEIDEERESTGTSLQWRVYVRGHNRRYRDEAGDIRLVTWVHPHVRGPEDAPWRHHRYAVLAGMLEREKEKIHDYLPINVRNP